jgi:hypothetical protein
MREAQELETPGHANGNLKADKTHERFETYGLEKPDFPVRMLRKRWKATNTSA